MNGNALGQPTMLQPGQMPMQGQNFQYAGFPHQDGGPTMTPGMVPGVPGSMGLNPGMGGPIQGQQNPPMATPGGGGASPPAGTPGGPPMGVGMVPGVPGSMGLNPGGGNFMNQLQDWRGQLQDWRQQRPDHTQGMDPGAFHQSMMAWRQQRPDLFGHFMGHGQQGAPNALTPPMTPPTPAPVAAIPVNQGMSASVDPNQYGLPTYGG